VKLALPSVRLPPLRYFLGGIVLYLTFLAATAPAFILNWALARFSANPISIIDIQGTLWSGEAIQASLALPTGQAFAFERIRWRFAPLRLLRGELGARIEARGAGLQVDGTVGRSLFGKTIHLTNFNGSVPASTLTQAVPALEIWKPTGIVELETQDFVLREAKSDGKAVLRWKDAAVTLSPVKPVGSYQLAAQGASDGLQYQVSTVSGPLMIDGKGIWAPDKPPVFNGTARAQQGYEGQMVDLLRLLGRDEGNGVFRIGSPVK